MRNANHGATILRWLEDAAFEGIKLPEVVTPSAQKRFAEVFYHNMDLLIALKEGIELFLYNQVKTLFDIEVDIIFYHVTSTYFEGAGSDNPQIVIGVVIAGGFPIAHERFNGNVSDRETMRGIVERLRKRFKIRRVVFVGEIKNR